MIRFISCCFIAQHLISSTVLLHCHECQQSTFWYIDRNDCRCDQSTSLRCPRSVSPPETPLSWEKPPARPATVPTTQYEPSQTCSSSRWKHTQLSLYFLWAHSRFCVRIWSLSIDYEFAFIIHVPSVIVHDFKK